MSSIEGTFFHTSSDMIYVHQRRPEAEKAIILLHGWMHSGARWTSLMNFIGDGYHSVAPDLPGFGKSAAPVRRAISLDRIIQAVLEVASTIHQAKPIHAIIAQSMGGIVALACLKKAPYLTQNMFLCDVPIRNTGVIRLLSGFRGLVKVGISLTHRLPSPLANPLIRVGALPTVISCRLVDNIMIEDAQAADSETAATLLGDIARTDLLPLIAGLKLRHVVISRGEKDRLVSAKDTQALCHALGGVLLEFRGASHTPHLEVPESFNGAVLAFIQNPRGFVERQRKCEPEDM